ncbi:MAG: DUF7007 domain-containing protein [Acidobacteriaceae bacterium]
MYTPWGKPNSTEVLGPGIVLVDTPSHGGTMVHTSAIHTLPKNILGAAIPFGEWFAFEEDCAASLVFAARPDLYRKHLQRSLDSWRRILSGDTVPDYAQRSGPECVAKLTAQLAKSDADLIAPLVESNLYWFPELFGLGPRCDECKQCGCVGHQHEMVVVSAFGDWHKDVPKGMVGVVAILGGRTSYNDIDRSERYFLVPAEEYDNRQVFFVVDPERHAVWETEMAPSTKQVTSAECAKAYNFFRWFKGYMVDR